MYHEICTGSSSIRWAFERHVKLHQDTLSKPKGLRVAHRRIFRVTVLGFPLCKSRMIIKLKFNRLKESPQPQLHDTHLDFENESRRLKCKHLQRD